MFILAFASAAFGLGSAPRAPDDSFGADVEFLRAHTAIVVLHDGDSGTGARVAVAPSWQGRVMTSAAAGDESPGFGWINREFIAAWKPPGAPHMNAFGGEDRFWMGPEGGQFSIYFKKGDPFEFAHWQTPACIDTEGYRITSQDASHIAFTHSATLTNYSGTVFDVKINRVVRLIAPARAAELLGLPPERVDPTRAKGLRLVAYESENTITNVGTSPWTRETGALSIWILGMYKPTPTTTVAIPFRGAPSAGGDDALLGPIVNDSYFGKVPADRLKVGKGVLFFRCDGTMRTKIGLSPARAMPVAGSYDAAGPSGGVLTIVQFNQPGPNVRDYVNSMWEIQKDPFAGDVVNSYNDGPPAPGVKPMGPFYEIETSSPAAFLVPAPGAGASLTHIHRTFHFTGTAEHLDAIAKAVLGVGVRDIASAFTP